MNADQHFEKLKKQIDEYMATPRSANDIVGAFDWTALLTLIPVLLQFFVTDPNLRNIIQTVIDTIKSLFSGGNNAAA